jgi:hypothetical protein
VIGGDLTSTSSDCMFPVNGVMFIRSVRNPTREQIREHPKSCAAEDRLKAPRVVQNLSAYVDSLQRDHDRSLGTTVDS